MSTHFDSPGLTFNGVFIEEVSSCHGQHYWKASVRIDSIFGSQVEGGIDAIGPTREKALENLAIERERLYESIWA